jgi:hypothetical protein
MKTRFTIAVTFVLLLFLVVTTNGQYIGRAPAGNSTAKGKLIPKAKMNRSANLDNGVSGLTPLITATGHYYLSADGVGSLSSTMTIRVNKPTAAATVFKAYYMSTSTIQPISAGCVSLAGNTITWDGSVSQLWGSGYGYFYNYWADVTSIVAPLVNPLGAGLSTLDVGECAGESGTIEGETLLVIFSDATAAEKTIIIQWGALNPTGDSYSIALGSPIDPNAAGAMLDMGLGIGYSYDITSQNGVWQYSQIDVNGSRLTTSAGGEDDGTSANGALITVGGIGDSDANPPDPNALPTGIRSDDELYSLLPFITNTTTNVVANTINPSVDDNIFLSYFVLSGSAIILTDAGIVLSQTTSQGCLTSSHSVTGHVVDGQNVPIPGRQVSFNITSGPNSGTNGTVTTNANGDAIFTWSGNGGAGTDQIQACLVPLPSGPAAPLCSNVLAFEWQICTGCQIPTLSEWGLIILGIVLMIVATFYILKRGI